MYKHFPRISASPVMNHLVRIALSVASNVDHIHVPQTGWWVIVFAEARKV